MDPVYCDRYLWALGIFIRTDPWSASCQGSGHQDPVPTRLASSTRIKAGYSCSSKIVPTLDLDPQRPSQAFLSQRSPLLLKQKNGLLSVLVLKENKTVP